jgi:hypothetical protein
MSPSRDFRVPAASCVSACLLVLGVILSGVHLMAGAALSGQFPYDWPDNLYKINASIPESAKGYMVKAKEPLADVDLAGPDLSGNDSLSSFGAKGQKVPYSLVVYASIHICDVKVSVSDLKNEIGEKIASDRIRIRTGMRQVQYRMAGSTPEETVVTTRFLPDFEPFDLHKGSFREIYLLVEIPSGAKGGVYRGKVSVSPADRPATELEMSLEVFPFSLRKPANKKYGMYYQINDSLAMYGSGKKPIGKSEGENRAVSEVKQIKEYLAGDIFILDAGIQYEMADGKIRTSYAQIETALSVLRKAGVKKSLVVVRTGFEQLALLLGHHIKINLSGGEDLSGDARFYEAAKGALNGLKDVAQAYPEFQIILSHYSDEIDYPETRFTLYKELTKPVRQVPGFKMYVTFHMAYKKGKLPRLEKLRKELYSYADVVGLTGPYYERWLMGGGSASELKEELDGKGVTAWVYYNPNTPSKDAYFYRLVNGLGMWKNDCLMAQVPWIYFYARRDVSNYYNDLTDDNESEGGAGVRGFSFPSWKDGATPVPTKAFEGYREGVYDLYYLNTLAEQIKGCTPARAEAAGALEDAKTYLQSIRHRFPEPAEIVSDDKTSGHYTSMPPLIKAAMKRNTLQDLNDMRRKTAGHIISLLKVCGEQVSSSVSLTR